MRLRATGFSSLIRTEKEGCVTNEANVASPFDPAHRHGSVGRSSPGMHAPTTPPPRTHPRRRRPRRRRPKCPRPQGARERTVLAKNTKKPWRGLPRAGRTDEAHVPLLRLGSGPRNRISDQTFVPLPPLLSTEAGPGTAGQRLIVDWFGGKSGLGRRNKFPSSFLLRLKPNRPSIRTLISMRTLLLTLKKKLPSGCGSSRFNNFSKFVFVIVSSSMRPTPRRESRP